MRAPELGPQTSPIERRYGGTLGRPRGVNTSRAATEVPPDQFVQLVNVRWAEAEVFPRGGCTKVNSGALHGADASLYVHNFDPGAPLRIWLTGVGCPAITFNTGVYLGHYDPEQCPRLQRLVHYATAAARPAIGGYGGVPHVVIGGVFRKLSLGKVPWGTEAIEMSSASQDTPIHDFSPYFCNAMLEYDGRLFFALERADGTGKIATWDGTTILDDLTGLTNAPKALGLWADSLIVGFGAAEAGIRLRVFGDPPGTYTTVAGALSVFPGVNSIVSFRGKAYFASGSTSIWRYDGATLSSVRTVASAVRVDCLAEAFGRLYYGYGTATTAKLGYVLPDGSTWNDAHKNLTTQVPGTTAVAGLQAYRGSLAAAVIPAGPAVLALSPLGVTDGTYELLEYPGAFVGDVVYLLVM